MDKISLNHAQLLTCTCGKARQKTVPKHYSFMSMIYAINAAGETWDPAFTYLSSQQSLLLHKRFEAACKKLEACGGGKTLSFSFANTNTGNSAVFSSWLVAWEEAARATDPDEGRSRLLIIDRSSKHTGRGVEVSTWRFLRAQAHVLLPPYITHERQLCV